MLWATYALINLVLISLWLPQRYKLQHILLIFSITLCLAFNFISFVGLIFLALLATAMFIFNNYKLKWQFKLFLALSICIISLGLMGHLFPGFYNVKIIDSYKITLDAIPYNLFINFDKAYLGIIILCFYSSLLANNIKILNARTIRIYIFAISSLILLSYTLGYINFEPKIPVFSVFWLVNNLMLVCLPEEAFCRLFLQKNLQEWFSKRFKNGGIYGLMIASFVFGMLHFQGGWKYVLLSVLAGYFYGLVFYKTSRIEASILLHYLVNVIHFFFFTYPALG